MLLKPRFGQKSQKRVRFWAKTGRFGVLEAKNVSNTESKLAGNACGWFWDALRA